MHEMSNEYKEAFRALLADIVATSDLVKSTGDFVKLYRFKNEMGLAVVDIRLCTIEVVNRATNMLAYDTWDVILKDRSVTTYSTTKHGRHKAAYDVRYPPAESLEDEYGCMYGMYGFGGQSSIDQWNMKAKGSAALNYVDPRWTY